MPRSAHHWLNPGAGRFLVFLCAVACTWTGSSAFGQAEARVSDPDVRMAGQKIYIGYDILNSTADDQFRIELIITDERGNLIRANALEGDIGESVSGGTGKEIIWDLEADRVTLKRVFFEVSATLIAQPQPSGSPGKEPTSETTPGEANNPPGSGNFSRTGLMLQSIALPGLGLSRLTGNPHWIRGAAAYGCIAGAVFLNQQARNSYNTIGEQPDFDSKRTLYEESIRKDQISEYLSFAAIGIWVADIIWTFVGTRDLNQGQVPVSNNRFSISGSMDPMTMAPSIGINYRF